MSSNQRDNTRQDDVETARYLDKVISNLRDLSANLDTLLGMSNEIEGMEKRIDKLL